MSHYLIYQPLIAASSINKKIEVLQTLSIYQHVTDKKSWFFANRQMSVWPQCVWNIMFLALIINHYQDKPDMRFKSLKSPRVNLGNSPNPLNMQLIFSMIIRARNMIFHTHWGHTLIYRLAKNHDFLSVPCWWMLRACKTSIFLLIEDAAVNGWYMR